MAQEEKNKSEEVTKRRKLFEQTIKELNKKNKDDDTIINLLPDINVDVEKFSSGSLALDCILGGGFPKGRIIEIYGAEGSGKTSIALTAIGNVQKQGGNCVFIDAENAFDPRYAKTLGVDLDKLAFSQVGIAEDVLQLTFDLARSGAVDLIVIDSVAALSPRSEYEESIDKQQMAPLARVMSKGLRKIITASNRNNCAIIFLNQTRDNVGVMFGSKTTTSGGKALRFYASQRIQVIKTGVEKEGDEVIGTKVKFKCVKNKVAPPFGESTSVLTFAKGINLAAEALVLGEELGVLKKEGRTYYYETDKSYGEEYPNEDGRVKLGGFKRLVLEALEIPEIYNDVSKEVLTELKKKNEMPETLEELEEPEEE